MANKHGAWWVAGIGGLAGSGMPLLTPHLAPAPGESQGDASWESAAGPAPACAPGCQGSGPRACACPAPAAPAARP